MTIFHVLKHQGQKGFDTEPYFPLWVVLQYRQWWKTRPPGPGDTPRQAVWKLLEEYDPHIHGEELYIKPDWDSDQL